MGRDKRDRGAASRNEGDDGGGAAAAGALAAAAAAGNLAYASDCCGLCKQALDREGEEHISGYCTVCKRIPLHTACVEDYLEKVLKQESKDGSHTSKSLKSVLLVANSRPHELIATNGRPPKWTSLRRCCACQEGEMVTAELCKVRKAAPAAPAVTAPVRPPKPALAAKKPAAAQRQPAAVPPAASRRGPVETGPSPAERLHGSGSANTFAAEQERLAREAKQRERAARQAAKAAKQSSADGGEGEGVGEGEASSEASFVGGRRASSAASELPWWGDAAAASAAASTGAATPQLSHQTSTASSPTPWNDAPPAYGSEMAAGSGAAAWAASDAHAPSWADSAGSAAAYGAAPEAAAAAAVADPGTWLPPQFEGREEAPEEEIDDLMALMGLG